MKIQKITKEQISSAIKHNKDFTTLLQSNKGFIEKIILKYLPRNDQRFDELYWTGSFSLYKALKKFNPERTNASTFSTFAYNVIKNDVLQEIMKTNKIKAKESSMELFRLHNDNDEETGYNESFFKVQHYNFEERIVNNIARENIMNKFSDLERKIIYYKMQKYTMQQIAKLLNKNFHTIKEIYFQATKKPHFKELFGGKKHI